MNDKMKLIINTNNINNKEQLEFLLEKHLPASFELYKKTNTHMYYKGPINRLVDSITYVGKILNKKIKYTIVNLDSNSTIVTHNRKKDLNEDDKEHIKAFIGVFKDATEDVKVNDEVLFWNTLLDSSEVLSPHLKEVLYVFNVGIKELSKLKLQKNIEIFQSDF